MPGELAQFQRFSLRDGDEAAIFTRTQGRGWDASSRLSVADIEDLISSISRFGLIQPVVLEHIGDQYLLISGERRLRAMRWGSVNDPTNPHFTHLIAAVIEGPMSDEDRRRWQLIENLAREDLQPGELAAALMYQRCAMLTAKLVAGGVPTQDIPVLDDSRALWEALDGLRIDRGLHACGAPWPEVIGHLGLVLSPRRAENLVRAFRALPEALSAEMDTQGITLASRQAFVGLMRSGRTEAAQGIWDAIGDTRPELLTRACELALDCPDGDDVDIDDVIAEAAQIHDREPADDDDAPGPAGEAAREELATFIQAGEQLRDVLRAGKSLPPYGAGSLRLVATELLDLTEAALT